MSRLSFRPRPLDIHKKLPIVKSIKDLDLEDAVRSLDGDCENLQVLTPAKKAGVGSEIPTPQYVVVESYERDYTRSFVQPPSYIRGRPARSENVEFCEYDLDSDDEHWLLQFNSERKILPPEKFEMMLYKLEIMDHKAAEKQGTLVPVLASPIPVVLSKDSAFEVLKQVINRPAVLGAVFDYWRTKREIWQKPILRRLQPPPPVNDTNPFNVFRPREKIHRPHTRRMQRRENDIQSFEKLKQVRYVIERSLVLVRAIQQREEKKRELVEVEANIQRLQLKLKAASQYAQYEALRLGEDTTGVLPSKFGRSEEGHRFMSKWEHANGNNNFNPSMSMELTPSLYDSTPTTVHDHQDIRRPRRRPRFPPARNSLKEKMKKLEPMEPVFLFTKPLDATKLAAAGITTAESKYRLAGRVGRGGRLVFDRWNPLLVQQQQPLDHHFHHSSHHHHHHSHSHHVMSIGAPPMAGNRFGARPGFRRTHVVEPLALPDTILYGGGAPVAPPTTSAAPF